MSILGQSGKTAGSTGKIKKPFEIGSLFRDWKPVTVIAVLIWSLTNLIQVVPNSTVQDWKHLADLSGDELRNEVMTRVHKLKGYDQMNEYQKEDAVKTETDNAAMGNNIQILGHIKGHTVFTNLKLGLDLKGGSQLLLKAVPAPPAVPEITPEVMKGVETVINNRINSLGVSETLVQRAGKDRLIVEMPGIKDPQQAKDRIGTTALLEFKEMVQLSEDSVAWKDVDITGADFKHAQSQPMAAGNYQVDFEFKPEGAKKFGALTTRLVGKFIGIFLDGQPVDRGPDGRPVPIERYQGVRVNEPINGGRGQITGSFTRDQAMDLALKLNAGALPVPIQILEERTVGATLGQDSIHKSLIAGGVGILAVMIFMIAIYGWPGLIADLALILYAIATLAVFKAIPVTLTLAGIAGFILSIGMAVDANILIFERTKEELSYGRNLYVAIENGFTRAMSSIFDSNVNSLIACGVLMMFGTSVVKGFAVTLAIGVALSMFTAISATRAMLHLIPKEVGLFGHRFDGKSTKKEAK
ncbi:MAG: protein translocase subunit SecD [Candidatus Obscuribacter sp.]|jgi:preprotein translocase subunit SecD|nr:protein translocase subunit SecD [Candidatus Obscuribacter sp.]MDQ5964870.1 preprotein translocase subunit SecD [Cyanobacteriota bacterium erpe_2018_sw_39hr_WHONDRS-SW48-000098_B_bin.30]MBK7839124.1 protein translocase subunit SecD [Candidatus Obscuribacter sp.]MBK9203264.1 protein translocase subunit SecD [Candidatus Obscuribacter sp.]MBK9619370.1 protein translocase subunit SecD [Candidatus Obscuribacter sp.]